MTNDRAMSIATNELCYTNRMYGCDTSILEEILVAPLLLAMPCDLLQCLLLLL
jgi:hypothetical protein